MSGINKTVSLATDGQDENGLQLENVAKLFQVLWFSCKN